MWKKTTLSHHHQRIPRWPNPSSPLPLLHLHHYYRFFNIRSTICFIIMLLFSIYCPQKLLMKLSKKKKICVFGLTWGSKTNPSQSCLHETFKKNGKGAGYATPLEAMADLKNLFHITCVYTRHVFVAIGSHLQRDRNCLLPWKRSKLCCH